MLAEGFPDPGIQGRSGALQATANQAATPTKSSTDERLRPGLSAIRDSSALLGTDRDQSSGRRGWEYRTDVEACLARHAHIQALLRLAVASVMLKLAGMPIRPRQVEAAGQPCIARFQS